MSWLGECRRLTQTDRVTLADARHLVELLDTGGRIDPIHHGVVDKTKSSAELAGLTDLVEWAKAAGAVIGYEYDFADVSSSPDPSDPCSANQKSPTPPHEHQTRIHHPSTTRWQKFLRRADDQYDAEMNQVEFMVESGEDERHMVIKVDGVVLEELARRAESRSARSDRQENLAGAYSGLTELEDVRWPSRHFLGTPALSGPGGRDTALLGCNCGEWGCWPLFAEVHVADSTVTWREFRNGHRPSWDLSDLGPFVFDRAQYESSLRGTERRLRFQAR